MMSVEEKEEAKVKVTKAKAKAKADVTEKIRLPLKSEMPSLSWLCHLRQMVKEADASLLKDKEVIQRFNALMDLMIENVRNVWSNMARGQEKYRKSFRIEEGTTKDPIAEICTISYQAVHQPAVGKCWYYRSLLGRTVEDRRREMVLRDQIIELYRPLWERVRNAVEPYMESKIEQIDGRNRKKRLETLVMMLETEEVRYQEEKTRLEIALANLIKEHEERVNRRRAEIARLSAARV